MLVVVSVFFAFCPFYLQANVELSEVNNIVEQKAQQLDQDHGFLMTATERDNYKVKVIAKKLIDKQAANTELSFDDLVNDGITTYEINDVYEQRQLVIELEIMGNGAGIIPPTTE